MAEYGFGRAASQLGSAIGQSSQISSNRRNMEERQMAMIEHESSIEELAEREILAKKTIANHRRDIGDHQIVFRKKLRPRSQTNLL